jgi:hypothetical protein
LKKRERGNTDARSNFVVIFLLAKNGKLQWLMTHTTMCSFKLFWFVDSEVDFFRGKIGFWELKRGVGGEKRKFRKSYLLAQFKLHGLQSPAHSIVIS